MTSKYSTSYFNNYPISIRKGDWGVGGGQVLKITPSSLRIFVKNSKLARGTFQVIFLLNAVFFHRLQEKHVIWHHSTPFSAIWCFWYAYWPSMGYKYVDHSKTKKYSITMFRKSVIQKLEQKCFVVKKLFSKNLNNH